MSIEDVIKKSFLESEAFNQSFSTEVLLSIILNMLAALIVGWAIYETYKHNFNGVVYSRSFALTLIGMSVLTCMVTLAISTNVIISLGMVGALSIVRYRTAVKEPVDLLYLFWAITSGITVGAGMYVLVLVGYIIMVLFIVISHNRKNTAESYILMVRYKGNDAGDKVLRELGKINHVVKSKVMRDGVTELSVQLRCREKKLVFVDNVQAVEGVQNTTVVKYNGEYHG